MKLTMSSVYYLMGMDIVTPSLLALCKAGAASGLKVLDDVVLLNETVRDQFLTLLRGDPNELGFRSGVIGTEGASGELFSVRVGPEYLKAAEAFLSDPCPRTLHADWDAYHSLKNHIDRISESL